MYTYTYTYVYVYIYIYTYIYIHIHIYIQTDNANETNNSENTQQQFTKLLVYTHAHSLQQQVNNDILYYVCVLLSLSVCLPLMSRLRGGAQRARS